VLDVALNLECEFVEELDEVFFFSSLVDFFTILGFCVSPGRLSILQNVLQNANS